MIIRKVALLFVVIVIGSPAVISCTVSPELEDKNDGVSLRKAFNIK